jgi:hypothetical protein
VSVPAVVTDAATIAGSVTVCAGAVSLVVGRPCLRWLRRMIAEELATAIGPVRAELSTNGGSSVKDAVGRLELKTAQLDKRLDRSERDRIVRQAQLDQALADLGHRMDEGHRRFGDLESGLRQTIAELVKARAV